MVLRDNGIKDRRKHLIRFFIPGINADGAVRVFYAGSDGFFKGKSGIGFTVFKVFEKGLGQVFFDKGRGCFREKRRRQNPLTLIGRRLGRNSPGQQGLDLVQNTAL